MRCPNFVNHSHDYIPNWAPLSPINIINYLLPSLPQFKMAANSCNVKGNVEIISLQN